VEEDRVILLFSGPDRSSHLFNSKTAGNFMPNQYTKKKSLAKPRKVKDRAEIMKQEGHKDDSNKARYDLIPAGPLHLLALLYTIGGVKYADENWRKGLSFKRLFGALMRHAWAWMRGQSIDPETGLHHMVCVAWCAFAIVELQLQHKRDDLDDRFRTALDLDISDFETALDAMIEKKKKEQNAG
jgi:hypothetical protein